MIFIDCVEKWKRFFDIVVEINYMCGMMYVFNFVKCKYVIKD